MNVADSEVVASVMGMAGYEVTESQDEADAVFLNTCSVRDNAEQKILSRLDFYHSLQKKQGRRIIVGVLGCMAERVKDELIDKYHITYSDAVESSIVANKLDMIKALEILSDDINTADELIEKISNIFSDRKKGGISLSTVHKAKGLEAENVYIACRELMPSSRAKKDWEIRQEYNLMYVAYTRAKDILGFIDGKEFEDFNKKTSETVKALKAKEAQVNYVLKKERKKIDVTNPFIANDIIRHATKIEKPKAEYKVMPLMKDTSVKSGIAFNDIFKRRFIKR